MNVKLFYDPDQRVEWVVQLLFNFQKNLKNLFRETLDGFEWLLDLGVSVYPFFLAKLFINPVIGIEPRAHILSIELFLHLFNKLKKLPGPIQMVSTLNIFAEVIQPTSLVDMWYYILGLISDQNTFFCCIIAFILVTFYEFHLLLIIC